MNTNNQTDKQQLISLLVQASDTAATLTGSKAQQALGQRLAKDIFSLADKVKRAV